jgi:beta-glucanase (GH16 family)
MSITSVFSNKSPDKLRAPLIMTTLPEEYQQPHGFGEEIIFFDDFTAAELDRTKWNVRTTGPVYNQEQQAYVDSQETIYIEHQPDEGKSVLVIHPHYHPGFVTQDGKRFDFISGRIDSRDKLECQFGIISARIKLATGTGVWPAFWMNGSGHWPASGEIDIMENVGDPRWVNAAIHGPGYCSDDGPVERFYFPTGDSATDWHVYSVEWTPDGLSFKVGDRLFFLVTPSITTILGPWVFNNPKHILLNVALGGIYPFNVNNIHVPHLGFPEETIQLIRQDKIKMLVDWVKVTAM